ncbi:AI-2E family transporter [Candidatus Saganbacteria bacterium]|nr:AI-2E family transporter [Candidatus Saganbacteria bacterium]
MSKNQITRIVFLVLFCVFLFFIRNVLFPIIISIAIFYLLDPIVNFLSHKRPKGLGLNRIISIFISFMLFIIIVGVLLQFILPPFIEESGIFVSNAPKYIAQAKSAASDIQRWYRGVRMPQEVNLALSNALQGTFSYFTLFLERSANSLIALFSRFIYIIIMPIIIFFLLKDEKDLAKGIVKFIPEDHREAALKILRQIDDVLKNYVTGQLILCAVVGVATGLALCFMGVNFFLILGLIAAISQVIPNIGPFIGAAPAIIVALIGSPVLALYVLIFFVALNILMIAIFIPKVLGDKLNLHPLTVVMSVLILGELFGLWGLFFAAPIVAILKIIYLELQRP